PDGINARIVDRYDFPALIFYRKPERLENLDAANAHAHSLLQTSSFFLAKVRFIDPTEIRRKEYKDPIAGNLSGYLQMLFVEIVFRSTIKTHAHPYARLIHFVQKLDRKSTRLNSSHVKISYAVFC